MGIATLYCGKSISTYILPWSGSDDIDIIDENKAEGTTNPPLRPPGGRRHGALDENLSFSPFPFCLLPSAFLKTLLCDELHGGAA
jgi:hypothetical protein